MGWEPKEIPVHTTNNIRARPEISSSLSMSESTTSILPTSSEVSSFLSPNKFSSLRIISPLGGSPINCSLSQYGTLPQTGDCLRNGRISLDWETNFFICGLSVARLGDCRPLEWHSPRRKLSPDWSHVYLNYSWSTIFKVILVIILRKIERYVHPVLLSTEKHAPYCIYNNNFNTLRVNYAVKFCFTWWFGFKYFTGLI